MNRATNTPSGEGARRQSGTPGILSNLKQLKTKPEKAEKSKGIGR
jgi:hypothetical protein